MEHADANTRMEAQMRSMRDHAVIRCRRFLDDEQLTRTEQQAVLGEIYNANVRDKELSEMTCHFTPILRADHPVHLALWGKSGTGKTLTMSYFLRFLEGMCRKDKIRLRHVHLDLATARPCFRALNDLACILNASKRYQRGISLEELMERIESALGSYQGYFVLFVDEVDNVRRDRDTFLTFLIRRLPQRIQAKLILVFASNSLSWSDQLDPRLKSFLKVNDLVFEPYDALDLQKILDIRVSKALHPGSIEDGVVAKIAALSSREHGDARKAVALLARSASLAERQGSHITLDLVEQAASQIEEDKYIAMIRTAPVHLQAVLAGIIEAVHKARGAVIGSGDGYESYKAICRRASQKPLTGRAFADLVAELDLYAFVRTQVESRGRYGRRRNISLAMDEELSTKIHRIILVNFGIQRRLPDWGHD